MAEFLAKKGYDKVYGARPLRRTIQSMVEDKRRRGTDGKYRRRYSNYNASG